MTQTRVSYYLGTGGTLGNCELISCTSNADGLTMDQSFTNFSGLDQDNNNLDLFPNPTTTAINLRVSSLLEEQVSLKIMDTQGKIVRLLSVKVEEGHNLFELPMIDLPTGTYFVQIRGAQLLLQDTFIKL